MAPTALLLFVLPSGLYLPPQSIAIMQPNAGRQLLPKAGAQRTLEAVSCTPWLGFRVLGQFAPVGP